jgi:hypothetical protein
LSKLGHGEPQLPDFALFFSQAYTAFLDPLTCSLETRRRRLLRAAEKQHRVR